MSKSSKMSENTLKTISKEAKPSKSAMLLFSAKKPSKSSLLNFVESLKFSSFYLVVTIVNLCLCNCRQIISISFTNPTFLTLDPAY